VAGVRVAVRLLLGGLALAGATGLHVAPAGATGDLQAMLDAAVPGSTVTVPAGTHTGNFTIDAPITLVGAPGAVLDGQGEGSVLTVAAPDVEVSGILVRGSERFPVGAPSGILVKRGGHRAYLHDLEVQDSYMGITVQRARDVVIERVTVRGSGIISGELHAVSDVATDAGGEGEPTKLRGDGIWLFDSERTIVRDSVIETVRDGVQLTYGSGCVIEGVRVSDSRYGLHDMYAADAAFRGNDLSGNLSGIVLMYGGPVAVEANTITENGSPSTGFGVLVKDAGGVLLRDNVIADNRVAVHIDDAGRTGGEPARLVRNTVAVNQIGVLLFPSADAWFTDNGFVENTTQVALGGTGRTQAVWTVDGVGNYWSDYGGFDAGGDGTGDLAYSRSGRTSQLIAEDPVLLALASGPAFRLLSAVEERWAPAEPLVLDDAPLTELSSPPLAAERIGPRAPLWIPGLALTLGCGWLLVRARRRPRRVVAA
jgi:nitrous oxidase accessory protein